MVFSNFSPEHLQDKIVGPRINKAYKQLTSKKGQTDGYKNVLMGYARSPFRDFESYLRFVVGVVEDDFQLVFKQYNSNFITFEKPPEQLFN